MEVLDKPVSIVAAYTPFYAKLAALEKENSELVFSYEDPRGNKEARSHVYKLRQTKGALERKRKEAKAQRAIAASFGVSPMTVSRIINNKTWS